MKALTARPAKARAAEPRAHRISLRRSMRSAAQPPQREPARTVTLMIMLETATPKVDPVRS
ncbi:hypothetical protein AWI43_23580 [Streptomyces sp. WAC04657]|nr:hypothetical protein AWI43_23580 [Streptomyces sp. WAC04657]